MGFLKLSDLQKLVPIREKEFMQWVIDYARLMGWLVYHPYRCEKSEPGFPDLTMARNHRTVYAELKVSRNKLTWAQRRWLDALAANPGNEVKIWRPEDWSDIEETLR